MHDISIRQLTHLTLTHSLSYFLFCSFVCRVMNQGFRGTTDTLFPQQVTGRLDTKIQFCIAGVKNVDNSAWYSASDEVNMKSTLDEGGMETLNVYVNDGGGSLGYAYFPENR